MLRSSESSYSAAPATPESLPASHLRTQRISHLPRRSASTLAEFTAPPFSECVNPLDSASILSLLSMQWFQPLVTLGAAKVLEKEDFWPLSRADRCKALEIRFDAAYAAARARGVNRQDRALSSSHSPTTVLGLCVGVESPVGDALTSAFRRGIFVAVANFVAYIAAMALQ
ncbi:hypothetical protein PybrP1_010748, partial [[Pythium] brassicae (nom. inval.)]